MGSAYTPMNSAGKYSFPSFPDLGKESRELFSKGYNIGQYKVNVKNRTCHGIEVCTTGVHTNEDKSAKGEVNVKAAYPMIVAGLSSAHKWDTDNILKNEISLQDTLYPGLKLTTELRYDAAKNGIGGGLKVQQKHPCFTLDALVDGADDKNLIVGGSIVTGHKGLMAAYKLNYDTNAGELKANNVGFAYRHRDYIFCLSRDNSSGCVDGTFHHTVNREIEIAAMGKVGGEGAAADGGEGGDNGIQFGIAGKYVFNGYGHALRAKVDNRSMLGVGLELKIMPGWQAFAAADVDLKKYGEGNHKIGFGMDFGYD